MQFKALHMKAVVRSLIKKINMAENWETKQCVSVERQRSTEYRAIDWGHTWLVCSLNRKILLSCHSLNFLWNICQGAVSVRFRSSFFSTMYTSLGANLPAKNLSKMTPSHNTTHAALQVNRSCNLSCTWGMIHMKNHIISTIKLSLAQHSLTVQYHGLKQY